MVRDSEIRVNVSGVERPEIEMSDLEDPYVIDEHELRHSVNENVINSARWSEFMKEPTVSWNKRKSNIFLHILTSIFFLLTSKISDCGV